MTATARKSHLQVIQTLAAAVTPAVLNGQPFVLGVIPAGGFVVGFRGISTTVSDQTTAQMQVGLAPGASNIGAINMKAVTRSDTFAQLAASGPFAVDTPIYATPLVTGPAATVGVGLIAVEFIAAPG